MKDSNVREGQDNGKVEEAKDSKSVKEFQEVVKELLVRHKSILDCLAKFQESTARVNRSITKTVTLCGCVSIQAGKQEFPEEGSLKDCVKYAHTHLEGQLCESCMEIVEDELGNHLFYLVALCNLLGVDLKEVLSKESSRLNTLGYFFLS